MEEIPLVLDPESLVIVPRGKLAMREWNYTRLPIFNLCIFSRAQGYVNWRWDVIMGCEEGKCHDL